MKWTISVFCVFAVVFSYLCGSVPNVALADISSEIAKTAAETPTIPIEKTPDAYVSQILTKPSPDDPRWVLLPKEEMAEHMQLLVDSQNSNYERIQAWKGSYYQVRRTSLSQEPDETAQPAYALTENLYTFARDFDKDKCFMRLDRLVEQFYDKRDVEFKSGNYHMDSNICAILTKDEYWVYRFDLDQICGELEGVMPGYVSKVCNVMPADQQRDVSRISSLFDPRFFFYSDYTNQHKQKIWGNVENAFIAWLRDEKNKVMHKRAWERISVWRGSFDEDIWYRVVYFEEDKTSIRDEYWFNSSSGFNMVFSSVCDYGVPFAQFTARFTEQNDVKFPEEYVIVLRDQCYIYFKLIDSEINGKLPDDQFTKKAMGLEDDTMVFDDAKERVSKYENDRMVPVTKYGATKTAAQENSFWRSPVRIAAFVLGIALVLFVGVRRLRRKAA